MDEIFDILYLETNRKPLLKLQIEGIKGKWLVA
jgi:hypothetical protein